MRKVHTIARHAYHTSRMHTARREQQERSSASAKTSSFRDNESFPLSSRRSFTDASAGGGNVRTNRTWSEERRASAPATASASSIGAATGTTGGSFGRELPRRSSKSGYTFTVAGVDMFKETPPAPVRRSSTSETTGGVTGGGKMMPKSSSERIKAASVKPGGASVSSGPSDLSSGDSWLSARRKEGGAQPRRRSSSKKAIANKYLQQVKSADVVGTVGEDEHDSRDLGPGRMNRTGSIAELHKSGLVKQLSGLWGK
jgi:hypothetical protein